MGNAPNKSYSHGKSIRPELLLSELYGEIREHDYFAKSLNWLDQALIDGRSGRIPSNTNKENFVNESISTTSKFVLKASKTEYAVPIDDIHQMAEPGYMILENGYCRAADGTWYIACLIDLGPDITGEMFDWWFCQCDNTEKYKWSHPYQHFSNTWNPQYYSSMPYERQAGHYVDHIQIIEHTLENDEIVKLQLEFTRPSKYFDTSRFTESNISSVIVARIFLNDPMVGLIAIGHLVYMVRERNDGGQELRCRFWLGDFSLPETSENILVSRMINYVTSLPIYKKIKVPEKIAKTIFIHCVEEMNCLKTFLPHFYETNASSIRKVSAARPSSAHISTQRNENTVSGGGRSDFIRI
eukprot:gene6220-8572_t